MTTRPFVRATSLDALRSETFDLVVVGGGVTGSGVVLDAAARGMKAALIERGDFASGTSSKSSKLVHGGLRYLQQGEVRLVYEALAERQRLLRNAPHLVRVLPFLIPMFGSGGVIPSKISRILGAAMWGYDVTGGWRVGQTHKRLDRNEALAYMPTLPDEKLVSAYLYFDAQADDARLVLTILRTAALEHGAVVANDVSAVGVSKSSDGQADGVEVMVGGDANGSGAERFTVRARSIVNAGGVWADEVRALDEGTDPDSIRPAKGIHVTVPWDKVRNQIAVVIPVPKDRRSIFVVPAGRFTYIGTTDTDYEGPIDDPQCTADDVEYLLRAINASCTEEITTDDVVGTWAGLRPLVKSAASGRTTDLSRRHNITLSPSGVITITGGKLTTYREMAADTVDHVVENVLAQQVGFAGFPKSSTKKLRLRGAVGFDTLAESAHAFPAVPRSLLDHLGGRYGGEARALMAGIQADPTLAEPIVAGLPYTRAEAAFAVRHEMARSVDDVLSRRTRARLLARDDSASAAAEVGSLIATDLGWTGTQLDASVEDYRSSVRREREAANLPETHLETLLGA